MGYQSTEMSKQDFLTQIQRLADVYGRDKFPQERVNLFWERVKNYSAVTLERAVSHIIANNKTAPVAQDIEESLRYFSKDKTTKELTKEELIEALLARGFSCKQCESTGSVWARSKENGNRYVFKCSCDFAQKDMKWPTWAVERSLEFEVER